VTFLDCTRVVSCELPQCVCASGTSVVSHKTKRIFTACLCIWYQYSVPQDQKSIVLTEPERITLVQQRITPSHLDLCTRWRWTVASRPGRLESIVAAGWVSESIWTLFRRDKSHILARERTPFSQFMHGGMDRLRLQLRNKMETMVSFRT
jgi:hypothetical protein